MKVAVIILLKYSTISVVIKGMKTKEITMIAATGFEVQQARGAGRMAGTETGLQGTCAVHLIDRRTGSAHRINGTPLVIFTRRPEEAAADLLNGRDPLVWEARIERLGPQAA